MKVSSLIACLVCFATIAFAAEDSKSIVVDRSAFSEVYPAVWFSPSTGEIAPLKERSETPPAGKYEIWIEPSDPEFGYFPEMKPGDVGFALVGKGAEVFENPTVPPQPKLDLKITHLMEAHEGGDGLVFYCRARTSECLIMITAMDEDKEVIRFKWRPLSGDAVPRERPVQVLVLIKGAHSEQGVGEMRALSVLDAGLIEEIEGFFPEYRKRPTSDFAVGTEAKYDVYFSFKDGRAVRLTVGADTGFWSAGRGSLETNGDFDAFVKRLAAKALATWVSNAAAAR